MKSVRWMTIIKMEDRSLFFGKDLSRENPK